MRKFSLSFHNQNMVESLWVPSTLRSKFTKRIDNVNQHCHFAGRSFICKELSLNIFSLCYNDLFEIKDGVFEIAVALLSFKLIYSYFLMIFILNPH